MTSLGPNTQRRYYPQQITSPSATSLLSSEPQRFSGGSLASNGSSNIHANFARGPPSVASTSVSSCSKVIISIFTVSCRMDRLLVPVCLANHRQPILSLRIPSPTRYVTDYFCAFYRILILAQYSLSADPLAWGSDLSPNHAEPDDYLHNPDPRRDRKHDTDKNFFTYRGLMNLGCLAILCLALLTLLYVFPLFLLSFCLEPLSSAGYPIISFFTTTPLSTMGGFNLGGTNATGQVGFLSTHVSPAPIPFEGFPPQWQLGPNRPGNPR